MRVQYLTFSAYEWYFMTPGYLQQIGIQPEHSEPVRLIVTFYREFFNNITQQKDYVISFIK